MVTFCSGIVALMAGIGSIFWINKFGRKTIIYVASIAMIIVMYGLTWGIYLDNLPLCFVTTLTFNGLIYAFTMPIGYIWMNEAGQPIALGIAFAGNWLSYSICGKILPYIYDNLALYWTPGIMTIAGIVYFILMRPLILETRLKRYDTIYKMYKNFKYRLCSSY